MRVNRKERRAQEHAVKRDVYDAMRAARRAGEVQVAEEIRATAGVDICPVCVSQPAAYAQRVTWKGSAFWICEKCAQQHTMTRISLMSSSHETSAEPVELLDLLDPNRSTWTQMVYGTGIQMTKSSRSFRQVTFLKTTKF